MDLRYARVPVDSPPLAYRPVACAPPPGTAASGAAAPALCDVLVRADAWFTDTRLRVVKGQGRYCFEVPPGQVWFDKTIRAEPPAPIASTGVHNVASAIGLLRHDQSGYMALMVGIAPDPGGREVLQPLDLSKGTACLTPMVSGALVLYPNDAVGRGPDPDYFYANNRGRIWVRIRRE